MRGVQRDPTARTAMKQVVQIVAGQEVIYSMNNGILWSRFFDREFYEVPDFVASGMLRRRWAVLAKPTVEPQQPQPVQPVTAKTAPTKEEADKKRR